MILTYQFSLVSSISLSVLNSLFGFTLVFRLQNLAYNKDTPEFSIAYHFSFNNSWTANIFPYLKDAVCESLLNSLL